GRAGGVSRSNCHEKGRLSRGGLFLCGKRRKLVGAGPPLAARYRSGERGPGFVAYAGAALDDQLVEVRAQRPSRDWMQRSRDVVVDHWQQLVDRGLWTDLVESCDHLALAAKAVCDQRVDRRDRRTEHVAVRRQYVVDRLFAQ